MKLPRVGAHSDVNVPAAQLQLMIVFFQHPLDLKKSELNILQVMEHEIACSDIDRIVLKRQGISAACSEPTFGTPRTSAFIRVVFCKFHCKASETAAEIKDVFSFYVWK